MEFRRINRTPTVVGGLLKRSGGSRGGLPVHNRPAYTELDVAEVQDGNGRVIVSLVHVVV